MLSAFLSRIIILVFGTLYPAYASYKAVKTKNLKEYVKWMMYWIVFALFITVETFADILLSFWMPLYYELKILFLFWLLSPWTKGSSCLYRKFVHPELSRREKDIDELVAKTRAQSYSTLVNYGAKGLTLASKFVAEIAVKGQYTLMNQLKKSQSLNDISPNPFMVTATGFDRDPSRYYQHGGSLKGPRNTSYYITGGKKIRHNNQVIDVDEDEDIYIDEEEMNDSSHDQILRATNRGSITFGNYNNAATGLTDPSSTTTSSRGETVSGGVGNIVRYRKRERTIMEESEDIGEDETESGDGLSTPEDDADALIGETLHRTHKRATTKNKEDEDYYNNPKIISPRSSTGSVGISSNNNNYYYHPSSSSQILGLGPKSKSMIKSSLTTKPPSSSAPSASTVSTNRRSNITSKLPPIPYNTRSTGSGNIPAEDYSSTLPRVAKRSKPVRKALESDTFDNSKERDTTEAQQQNILNHNREEVTAS